MSLSRAGVAGCVLALFASVVTGCAGTSHDTSAAAPQAPAADVNAATSPHSATEAKAQAAHHASAADTAVATSDGTTVAPAGDSATGHATRHASEADAADHAGLRGSSSYVWRLRATVSPSCVPAGGAATVTVHTAANAALAFVAIYANGKNGSAPPFGDGYGGNADGYSNDSGQWASTWTIRADAPRGPAKVTVVAASHQTTKQVDVPFTVIDPVSGHC